MNQVQRFKILEACVLLDDLSLEQVVQLDFFNLKQINLAQKLLNQLKILETTE